MKKLLSLVTALTLLAGCILVDDFGARWGQAKVDPCLSEVAKSLYIAEFRKEPDDETMASLARGLTLDGQHYLLLKKYAKHAGGRIYRFTITAGKNAEHVVLQRWRLDPAMRQAFMNNYPNAVAKLDRDTVTLPTLDGAAQTLLTEIANKPEYWQIDDQTLYNLIRDPKCIFDTRDLTKKD
jgi:hypothetical protein